MPKVFLLVCCVVLSCTFVACNEATSSETTVSTANSTDVSLPATGLVHQVYFWLQPGLDDEAKADFVAGMRSLAEAPTVREVSVGTAASTPEREVTDNSFDYFLTLHFDDVAGHDAYQVSDVHEAFVAAHEATCREVRVFDGVVVE